MRGWVWNHHQLHQPGVRRTIDTVLELETDDAKEGVGVVFKRPRGRPQWVYTGGRLVFRKEFLENAISEMYIFDQCV